MAPDPLDVALARFNKLFRDEDEPKASIVDTTCEGLIADATFQKRLSALSPKKKKEFDDGLWKLLKSRSLAPTYFEWCKYLAIHGKEKKRLRPRHDVWLGFKVVQHADRIEDFHLTTEEKNAVRRTFRHLIGINPNEDVPPKYKPAQAELEQLLAKSKNTNRKLRSTPVEDTIAPSYHVVLREKERVRNWKRRKRMQGLIKNRRPK